MADLVALRAELDKPAYTGLSNVVAAVAVMDAQITGEMVTTGADIGKLWARRGILGIAHERSRRLSGTPTLTNAQRVTAWEAITMVQFDGFSGLDPNNATQRAALVAFLDRLVTDTIMTAADKTATLALLSRTRTGREVFGQIDENDVARARAI